MSATIIAEAGVNHNGSIDLAFKLIDAAKAANADVVKFQTFSADKIVTRSAPTAPYQKANAGAVSQYDMLKQLELSLAEFQRLSDYCRTVGIEFMSTPFDIDAARFLKDIGMSTMKLASGELTNKPFLKAIGGMGLPIIMSTGMADLGEIEDALDVLQEAGTTLDQLTILHCTTEYPAPAAEVNLRAIATLRQAFPGPAIGYSDHTAGIDIPVAAVALGATLIEKHFTLDINLPGPDHKASLEPKEFAAMVTAIRSVEEALGDGRKRPTVSERKNMAVARKSIVAGHSIAKGAVMTAEMLEIRRPGTGISPMRWDEFVGRTATRDYAAGDLIIE